MTYFTASPLLPREVGRAFPLVQLLVPSVERRRWERFARSFLRSSRRGILTARDHRGNIRGLAIYRRQPDISGETLQADPVLFVDLLDSSEVALTLIGALEAKAREFGCDQVRVNMADRAVYHWPTAPGSTLIEMRQHLAASRPTTRPAR